jgi:hypothetical protein
MPNSINQLVQINEKELTQISNDIAMWGKAGRKSTGLNKIKSPHDFFKSM